MNAVFYTFAKTKNSTKQPANGTTIQVELKEDCSVMFPKLILTESTAGMPSPFTPTFYNYVYISKFSRYYYITDVRYILGHWEFSLAVDVLASFKTSIGGLSEYVLRASSAFDGSIADTLYPTSTGIHIGKTSFSLKYSNSGFYVVGIINNSSNAVDGAITYYMMTNAELGILKSNLMSETFLANNGLSNLQEMSKDLVKTVFNPFQYIVSCRFIPLDYNTYTTDGVVVSSIELGWWQLNISTKRMPAGYYQIVNSDQITIPAHPQAATRGDYLNHAPYTEHVLIHPVIGTISIDSNKITAGQKVQVSTYIDLTTGAAEVYVNNVNEATTIYRTSIQVAVDVQLAQISVDHLAVAQNAVNTVGNTIGNLMSFNVGGAIASAASGVLNHLSASQPIMQTSGSNGNRTVYVIPGYFFTYHRLLVNEDLSHRGRPLCQVKTINTLSGFIMCADAHAEITCMDEEKTAIIEYMNTGFYYE